MKPSTAQTVARTGGVCLLGVALWIYSTVHDSRDYDWLQSAGIAIGVAWIGIAVLKYFLDAIEWHAFRRKRFTEWAVREMRNAAYPKRRFSCENFSNYLCGVGEDIEFNPAAFSRQLRSSWIRLHIEYETAGRLGAGHEGRIHRALEDALEIYSPADDSPEFVSPSPIHWISQAKEAEIKALPHADGPVAEAIVGSKPFDSLVSLFQLLRRTGLPRAQAAEFLNAASKASDEWNKTRI